MKKPLKKNIRELVGPWWLILLAGILFFLIGIGVLLTPAAGYFSLTLMVAIGILVTGLFEVFFFIGNIGIAKGSGWILAAGLIDVFLGSYMLYYPLLSIIMMPILIGLWMLIRGFMAVGRSIDLKNSGNRDWVWVVLTGVVILIGGALIIYHPLVGLVNVVFWAAVVLMISGLARVYLSLKLRKLQQDLK